MSLFVIDSSCIYTQLKYLML